MSASHDSDVEQRLLDLVNEGVGLGGLDGRILRVNEAACRIAGLSEAELLQRSWWDLVEPGDRPAVQHRLHELARAGATREPFRFRLVRADGSHRWLELTLSVDRERELLLVLARDVTGRHVMDLERLMASFIHSALGMALVDHEGRFLRVNETLCALLDLSLEELRGRDMASVVAGEPGRWAAEALRSGERASFQDELRLRRAGGGEIVALVSGTLVADSGGRPQFYVCQVLDMTARHEALEALAANEAKLAEAQQIAGLGSWEWDVASGRVTRSAELHRMLGLAPDAGEGGPEAHLDLLHPDDRARVTRVVETAVAAVGPWSVDFRIVRSDGTLRMIHGRGQVVAGADGRAAAVHGTCQDVTERRRVEDALRATEQLFRRAFDDAPIGMALIDLEGRWLRLNPALTQMLGRDEDELRATRLEDLGHPADRDLDRPLIADLLAGRRRAYAVEKRLTHGDGRVIHALAHVSLMHGDGERPLYFLCQLVDLTERRRAEAERRAGEQRLRAIVDNSPALIIVKDLEHRYLLVNRRWEELVRPARRGRRRAHVGRGAARVRAPRPPGARRARRAQRRAGRGDARRARPGGRAADLPAREVPAAGLRRPRVGRLHDRHRPHRAPAQRPGARGARAPPRPGPAPGERRAARGRRRARLQQPAVGHPHLRRLRPARAAQRSPRARGRRRDRPRRRPCGGAHAPAPHVQPPRGRPATR